MTAREERARAANVRRLLKAVYDFNRREPAIKTALHIQFTDNTRLITCKGEMTKADTPRRFNLPRALTGISDIK